MRAQPRPVRAVLGHGHTLPDRATAQRHAATERARAVRTVAGNALDGPDCQMLLSILGLDAVDGMTDDGLRDRSDGGQDVYSSTRLPRL
jgi:hypothetical protein